jgi:hypothetical protein
MSQPSPPSPSAGIAAANQVAQGQQGYNVSAQAGSQYNQSDPYGSLNYSQTGVGPGGVPLYTASTSFSPAQQQLYGQYTGTQTQAGGEASPLLNYGNYAGASPTQQIGNMTSGTTGQLENAYLGSAEPFFQTQEQQLDTQLQNQGFTANSPSGAGANPNGPTASGNPAYNNAMRQLQTNQDQAVLGAAAQFEPQAFGQASQLYTEPLTVAQSLAQFGAPTSPTSQFTQNTPALQPANETQAYGTAQSAAEQQYQGQQAQYNAMLQGIEGIGSAALGVATGGTSIPFTSLASGLQNMSTGAVPGMPNYASAANPYNPLTGNYGIGG